MYALVLLPLLTGVLAGYALGGRLRWLAEHRVRAAWLLWSAVILQVVHWRGWRDTVESWLGFSLLVPIFVLAGVWAVVNLPRRPRALQTAVVVILLGGAMNAAAIAANGRMPFSEPAVRAAGVSAAQQARGLRSPKHAPSDGDTRLAWLGDVIPVAPIRKVISAGDVVLLTGVAVFIAVAMRGPNRVGAERRRKGPAIPPIEAAPGPPM